jgi:hypothetical protein
MFPRVVPVEERVRASERFPRIRDAEAAMKSHEQVIARKARKQAAKLRRAEEARRERILNPPSQQLQQDSAYGSEEPPMPDPDAQDNYFTSFTLTQDPDVLKYLPYGELHYPKMYHTSGDNAGLREYLDGVWMSGFMDASAELESLASVRDSTDTQTFTLSQSQSQSRTQTQTLADSNSVVDTIAMSSSIGTVSKQHKHKHAKTNVDSNNNSNTGNNVADNINNVGASAANASSRLLPPMPETRTRASMKTATLSEESLSEHSQSTKSTSSMASSHASKDSDEVSVASSTAPSGTGSGSTGSKRSSTTLQSVQSAHSLPSMHTLQSQQSKSISTSKISIKRQLKLDKMLADMMRPYQHSINEANTHPNDKKAAAPAVIARKQRTNMENVNLESYFNTQRIENEAAKKIQYFYRWSHMISRIRFVCVCVRMGKRIQRLVRGFLARKFVARWFVGQTVAAIKIQAQVRKFLSNNHIVPILMREQHAISQIQKIIRGHLGRLKFTFRKRTAAAIRMQKFWRGLISRLKSSRAWVGTLVVPLQSLVRKHIANKRVKVRRKELNKAALLIQRQFRSWSANRNMSQSLFEREMKYRMDMVTILTAEVLPRLKLNLRCHW